MKFLFKVRHSYSSDTFKLLRVYKNYSNWQLLNALIVNRAAASRWLVANSLWLYKLSSRVLGSTIPNAVIERTFGKVFTAGKTLDEVAEMCKEFQRDDIPVIIDYCGEGFVDEECVEAELDLNAEMFRLTAQQTSKLPNQMISIKVSGLVDMKMLRKLNNGVVIIEKFWERNSNDQHMTGEELLLGFQGIYGGVTEEDVSKFLKTIFGYEGQLHDFKCDKYDFKMKIHPYYVNEKEKNGNNLINLICPLSKSDASLIENLVRRIDLILQPFAESSSNFRIIMDAEQSYIQQAIFSISEQYQIKYNKSRLYIIPTLQNYIKSSPERIRYELELANRNDLVFSTKFVRGAYLVQERRIAVEKGEECPVVESFDQTTKNFLQNVETCLKEQLKPGSTLIIGSHNQETIEDVKAIAKKYPNSNVTVEYAQLLGLADHLTVQLKRQGYPVYKYLPYGPTSTMVPYLIRRAQELSQMKYPLILQYDLIKNEFRQRMGLES